MGRTWRLRHGGIGRGVGEVEGVVCGYGEGGGGAS
jgi:hypothetical protein